MCWPKNRELLRLLLFFPHVATILSNPKFGGHSLSHESLYSGHSKDKLERDMTGFNSSADRLQKRAGGRHLPTPSGQREHRSDLRLHLFFSVS